MKIFLCVATVVEAWPEARRGPMSDKTLCRTWAFLLPARAHEGFGGDGIAQKSLVVNTTLSNQTESLSPRSPVSWMYRVSWGTAPLAA